MTQGQTGPGLAQRTGWELGLFSTFATMTSPHPGPDHDKSIGSRKSRLVGTPGRISASCFLQPRDSVGAHLKSFFSRHLPYSPHRILYHTQSDIHTLSLQTLELVTLPPPLTTSVANWLHAQTEKLYLLLIFFKFICNCLCQDQFDKAPRPRNLYLPSFHFSVFS